MKGLEEYIHLQNVNVSNNNLATLKPLSNLKYLVKVNAKTNKLGKLLDFTYFIFIFILNVEAYFRPPLNLEEVDYSENEIKEIPDLSKNRFLRRLILDSNKICKIEGLFKNNNLWVF